MEIDYAEMMAEWQAVSMIDSIWDRRYERNQWRVPRKPECEKTTTYDDNDDTPIPF